MKNVTDEKQLSKPNPLAMVPEQLTYIVWGVWSDGGVKGWTRYRLVGEVVFFACILVVR